jgi:hypothetical protein
MSQSEIQTVPSNVRVFENGRASKKSVGPVEKVRFLLAFGGLNLDVRGLSISDLRIGISDEGG